MIEETRFAVSVLVQVTSSFFRLLQNTIDDFSDRHASDNQSDSYGALRARLADLMFSGTSPKNGVPSRPRFASVHRAVVLLPPRKRHVFRGVPANFLRSMTMSDIKADSAALMDVFDRRVERRLKRRQFFRNAGGLGLGLVGGTLISACGGGSGISSMAQTTAPSDEEILNFALNLEYLEAQFYTYATTGSGLPASMLTGVGTQGTVSAGAQVRAALMGVRKYQSLISDGGRLQLLGGTGSSWLICHPVQGNLAFSPHQIEAALSAMVTAVHWVHPDPAPPQRVYFSHERLGPLAGYRKIFRCPVEFQQAYNGLLVDNAVLDCPLPQGNAQLSHIHEQLASNRLQTMQSSQAANEALLAWLHAHIGPPLPTRAEAAAAFGLTERTLARRLQSLGTSFTELLDAVRCDIAMQQVRETNRLLTDIAHDLGFAGLSPFHRAFRRWTGSGPGQWRRSN
ncbi:MAG: AraC family transcriptional regulator ligand-binding domain-containing protein [Paraburkholderia sp.]|nr:helix-turn-helix domain-containing protein [Burkholderia sp. 4M9327F10]